MANHLLGLRCTVRHCAAVTAGTDVENSKTSRLAQAVSALQSRQVRCDQEDR